MGSSKLTQLNPSSDLYTIKNYQQCRVWLSKIDQVQLMEEYQIHISNDQQLQMYQNMFTTRFQQPFFPNTLYFYNQQVKYICGVTKIISLIIERIPYRLSSFYNIPYNLAISILFHSFNIYHLLFKSYGLFHVSNAMICFDRYFQIKAWHHTDLANLTPEHPHCQTLVEMINGIVSSVQGVSERPEWGFTFSQYLNHKKIVLFRFQLATVMIKQYLQCCNIQISNTFQDIQYYLPSNQLYPRAISRLQNNQQSAMNNTQKQSFQTNQVVDDLQQSQIIDDEFYNPSISKHYSCEQTDVPSNKEID